MSENNKIPFSPVRGYEENIQRQAVADGYVYFATDTGNIYVDAEGARHTMGGSGSSGIHYTNASEADVVKVYEDEEDKTYIIPFNDTIFEKPVSPKADDLLLNSDGRFFRVVNYDSETQVVTVTLIAISGSGGGGGEQESFKRRFKLNLEKPNPSTLINGQQTRIYFTVESAIDQNDNVLDDEFDVFVTLAEKVAGTTNDYINYYTMQLEASNDVRSYVDITEYLRESTTTKISLYAKGIENGTSKEYSVDVTTTALTLNNSASFSNLSLFASNSVNLSCEAIGRMDKILTFYFDGVPVETRNLSSQASETQTYKIDTELATQGAHEVKITLSQARVNATTGK